MATYNLNEILKKRASAKTASNPEEMDLGDTARVKVLSPGRQVAKRFMRNRLAIFGSVTLIIMFLFSFVGPIFYKYGQDETMYKYEGVVSSYAFVQQRDEYTGYVLDPEVSYNRSVATKTNSNINQMEPKGQTTMLMYGADGKFYTLQKEGERIYSLSQSEGTRVAAFGSGKVKIGVLDLIGKKIKYEHNDLGAGFLAAALEACKGKTGSFDYDGATYDFEPGSAKKSYNLYAQPEEGFRYYGAELGAAFESATLGVQDGRFEFGGKTYAVVSPEEGSYEVHELGEPKTFMLYTQYAFDPVVTALPLTDEFKVKAIEAVYGAGTFEATRLADVEAFLEEEAHAAEEETQPEGEIIGEDEAPADEAPERSAEQTYVTDTFTVAPSQEHEGVFVVSASDGTPYAELNSLVVRRYNGDDTMDLDLKYAIREVVQDMMASSARTGTLTYRIPAQTETGKNVYDEDGSLVYNDSDMTVNRRTDKEYVVDATQQKYLIDKFAAPSWDHPLGTDGDGFDVLARIMFGGRVSLMVGFVVVILETVLGVIMGGLAGFFGGWVDNLVMRLVDIFYCLPTMPIMIIIGAMMDASRMDVRLRLFIMMAALGIMGWAGIARLVRGQILSLREQEFMTAAEATGLPIGRRIFRHLVPNVMPQLIVSATMGLGSTILTESTLSFLGLGVKHPLATWGTMINSVSSAAAMEQYAYIWIPVGLLICFTVIAFNFVGDGLRDAFDPKGKR